MNRIIKRSLLTTLNPGGILRWSTACILAGGLASCDRGVRYVATEQDVEMASTQTQIEKLDSEKSNLISGEVTHNFHIPRVGYYHAGAGNFFEHPYGFEKDSRYFINGIWQDEQVAETITSSRPTREALAEVEAALEEEQKTTSNTQQHGGGFGMGNALMMYWLLAGNRGMFSPGNGFRQAGGQADTWQRDVEDKRSTVGSYAASNLGYQRMVAQSRSSGTSFKPGQSVRGGFGSARGSSGSTLGG